MTTDNRLRFPSTLIDFAGSVGLTGQDHDNYPPPQGQARYDHFRMVMIALLSQQSSFDEPIEYRDGTPWFDLNTNTLKIRKNDEWVDYSQCVRLEGSDTDIYTLQDWYNYAKPIVTSMAQEIVFNGSSSIDAVEDINIPEELRSFIFSDTRCFIYKNGLLIDPRNCIIVGNSTIHIEGITLNSGDSFTVIMKRIPSNTFYLSTVSIS